MRIVIKNIVGKDNEQVRGLLSQWIGNVDDPSCYYTMENNRGQFFASMSAEGVAAMAAQFNSNIRDILGPNSCIQISPVQELPASFTLDKTLREQGLDKDPNFLQFLKAPKTWSLQPKKKSKKKKPQQKARAKQQAEELKPMPTLVATSKNKQQENGLKQQKEQKDPKVLKQKHRESKEPKVPKNKPPKQAKDSTGPGPSSAKAKTAKADNSPASDKENPKPKRKVRRKQQSAGNGVSAPTAAKNAPRPSTS